MNDVNYTYDFHIHTALSPCAEEEMTPNNIVNMAVLNGLDLIAVTDHNSAKNLPAVFACTKGKPVVLVPGIEVESAEEVHISCFFPEVEAALDMGRLVERHLLPMKNKKEILGPQYIFNCDDEIIGEEEQMLLFSTDLPAEEVFRSARRLGGCAWFSHVDRDSYSVLSALGTLPAGLATGVVEATDSQYGREFVSSRKDLKNKEVLYSSDCHRLKDMSRGTNIISLPEDRNQLTAETVINWIKEKDMR